MKALGSFYVHAATSFVNAAVSHDLSVYGLRASEWLHVAGSLTDPVRDQQFYGLRPVLPVRHIQETLDYYREKLDFSVDFVTGDPPVLPASTRADRRPRPFEFSSPRPKARSQTQ